MLWLKKKFDPCFFDLDFLQSCSVRILPELEQLPSDRVQQLMKVVPRQVKITDDQREEEIKRLIVA
jgi:hypothetical protein